MSYLLDIKDLFVCYETVDGVVSALNGVSVKLREGETLGIVGETGAGKTTLAKSIMRIIPSPPGKIISGEVLFEGENLLKKADAAMRAIRGNNISMIFQDPMTSLNPVLTIGEQIAEVIKIHQKLNKQDSVKKAEEMLELVGIPKGRIDEYPHQFSGGMKQRVIIAIALACRPKLLIADEPTTALDVTIQAQVIELMKDLKVKFNTSMLLITHDLGVVAQICDYVAIVYAGEVVEYGTINDIFKKTSHPYTQGLLDSIPNLNHEVERLSPIKGLMPDPLNLPKGCKFSPRCNYAKEMCFDKVPSVFCIDSDHSASCFKSQGLI